MAAADLVVVDSQGVLATAHGIVCHHTQAAIHMQLADGRLSHLQNQLCLGCQRPALDLLGYHVPQGSQAGVKQEDEGRAAAKVLLHFWQLQMSGAGLVSCIAFASSRVTFDTAECHCKQIRGPFEGWSGALGISECGQVRLLLYMIRCWQQQNHPKSQCLPKTHICCCNARTKLDTHDCLKTQQA